jgi:hypothetical protein
MLEILITENQYSKLLAEAKKEDILVNKLGLSQDDAIEIVRICGALSIWIVKKLITFYVQSLKKVEDSDLNVKDILSDVKGKIIPSIFKRKSIIFQQLTSIMDFIRVGLNGSVKTIENLNFYELVEASKKWHEELQIGSDKIDYVEEGNILVDLRDENGIGFYWVDLETNSSNEECGRMGHCGRTEYGNTIISLREYKPLPNGHTLNKSHLTAAVGQGENDGIIFQLKGPKNSKPKKIYNPYIVKLLLSDDADINGFGSEYASNDDFKLRDLYKEDIELVYSEKPEIFKRRIDKKLLIDLGIIEGEVIDYNLTLFIPPHEIGNYVEGDYKLRSGKDGKPDIYFFESLFEDPWDIFNFDYYDSNDWKHYYDYIDKENEKIINDLVQKYIQEQTYDKEDIEDLDGIELIEYIDYDEIKNAINSAVSSANEDAYITYCQKQLKNALEEYGDVVDFSYSGVTLVMNLKSEFESIEKNDPDFYEEKAEDCDEKIECMFYEFLDNGIDKPKYSIDDRYYPSLDRDNFNSILNDRLHDI